MFYLPLRAPQLYNRRIQSVAAIAYASSFADSLLLVGLKCSSIARLAFHSQMKLLQRIQHFQGLMVFLPLVCKLWHIVIGPGYLMFGLRCFWALSPFSQVPLKFGKADFSYGLGIFCYRNDYNILNGLGLIILVALNINYISLDNFLL